MATWINRLARATASNSAMPLANPAVMAAEYVHPVPWVWGVWMRGAGSAGFRGPRRNIFEHRQNLFQHQIRRKNHGARQAHAVLHRDHGDHRFAVYTELVKRLQVRLNARTAGWVASGDRERNIGV